MLRLETYEIGCIMGSLEIPLLSLNQGKGTALGGHRHGSLQVLPRLRHCRVRF